MEGDESHQWAAKKQKKMQMSLMFLSDVPKIY